MNLLVEFEGLEESPSVPRELSWLAFNARVLQEADDPSVPIIQRLRYLGIFSNNMDEFFRVRVAEVRRLIYFAPTASRPRYEDLLSRIQREVMRLQAEFDRIYARVIELLQQRGIYLINEKQLDSHQEKFVREYFLETLLPELEPLILTDAHPIPNLTDASIYLAVDIGTTVQRYALIELPTDRLSRFVQIPRRKGRKGKVFIVLDNVIRLCLPQVFRGLVKRQDLAAYTIKFSRDAELEINENISQSLIEKVSTSLRQRRKADAVRFVYDSAMPSHMLAYFVRRFNIGKYDSSIPGGRYHNSKDFIDFPSVGPSYLEFKPLPTIRIPWLQRGLSIFASLREKDLLLFYPYHSFSYIVDLLKTAAVDPRVVDIKICLYRVAKQSRIIDALLNAVQNGKQVTAVVELQARFDEEANIDWARRLTEGGIRVIFGIPKLKVHSKLIVISRRENGAMRYYSHVGTGNFNEKTARLYTDFSLLTYNQSIGRDVSAVFDFIQYTYKRPEYRHLLVSPHTTRSGIEALIDREIAAAEAGNKAVITLKCNNLVDTGIAQRLYRASQAGVQVRLIVRGMCSVVPGVKGLSENIRAISIVDRFLEHPRIYAFHNGGSPLYYIGSADLMTRNLDFRVEVLCPILDEDARKMLHDIVELQWRDNVKARLLDGGPGNRIVPRKSNARRIRSQEAIYEYLLKGSRGRPHKKADPATVIKTRGKSPSKKTS